ncbi:MAG: pyridoxal phosphate-dependent aminotransferase [Gammaproteobacteria bacterium]|nr:pyridoxal phosphate-dependent aminotransferase [Gammaproteobacteria bacterium]
MPRTPATIARNVEAMEISVIKAMAMRAAATPGAVSLAWGVPSFATPPPIRAAVAAALEADPTIGRYTLPDGLPELRRLAAGRHRLDTGIDVDPDSQLVVTAGNMQGMSVLLHVLLDPGDEVVVTDPGFASHVQQVRLCGAVPRYWKLDEAAGWTLDLAALEDLLTPRTRAVIIVSPSNPTGRIFDRDSLLGLARIARERGFVVIVDDPYSRFVYDGAACFNLASAAEFADHLVYLCTFSKAYAMSGWRLGYLVAPPALKGEILKVHDANLICAPHVSQAAGIAALAMDPQPWPEFARLLEARRALICERLDRVPQVFAYQRPQGAYYVFPRIVAAHTDSRSFAIELLERVGVSVTPGSGFGPAGEGHVRMAYCVEEDTINQAFDRIEAHYGRET